MTEIDIKTTGGDNSANHEIQRRAYAFTTGIEMVRSGEAAIGCDAEAEDFIDLGLAKGRAEATTLIAALIPWAMAGGMPATELKAAEAFVGENG